MKRVIGWLLCWTLAAPMSFAQYTVPYPSHKKAGGGGVTPAISGSGVGCAANGFNTTDNTCAFTIVNATDTVCVLITSYAAGNWTPSVTSTKVSSYTASSNNNANTAAGAGKFEALFCGKANSSGSDTITCGKGGTTAYCGILVFGFSGLTTPTEDKTAKASSTSSSMDSGNTASTTAAVEVLIGCGYVSGGDRAWTVGTSVAWAQAAILHDGTAGTTAMCEYFVTSSTGVYHADATLNAGTDNAMLISTWKP